MTVYDCFVFCSELDILEWRLRELEHVVDYFVLAESTRTYSGKPKSLVYAENRDRFARWNDRIRHVVVENMPDYAVGTPRMYETEGIQRNAIIRGLYDAADDDWVLMSDVDEIPRASVVQAIVLLNPHHPVWTFEQRTYYYWLTLRAVPFAWMTGTRMARASVAKRLGGQALRMYQDGHVQPEAGWHFSYFGTPDQQRQKLTSWSHIEQDRPPMNQPGHFERCAALGIDWDIDRNAPMVWEPPSKMLPRHIWENIDQYAHYLGPQPSPIVEVPA